MSEEHVLDLLPGYALGCLDEADLITAARHLSTCTTCRKELEAYSAIVDQLPLAVPLLTTPTNLKQGVLLKIENENKKRTRMVIKSKKPPRLGYWDTLMQFLTGRAGFALGAAALLLIVWLGINNLLLSKQVSANQTQGTDGSMQIVQLKGTSNAPQAVGYMVAFKDENYGTLVVNHAPVLDSAHQYQVWLIHDGKRSSGGVFSVNEAGYGSFLIEAEQPLLSYQSLGVTIEPLGGSPDPTGKKIVGVEP